MMGWKCVFAAVFPSLTVCFLQFLPFHRDKNACLGISLLAVDFNFRDFMGIFILLKMDGGPDHSRVRYQSVEFVRETEDRLIKNRMLAGLAAGGPRAQTVLGGHHDCSPSTGHPEKFLHTLTATNSRAVTEMDLSYVMVSSLSNGNPQSMTRSHPLSL